MNRRHFSTLEMVINILYFIACVIVFIVALVIGFMKILETVTPTNVLLYIGFFFLAEIIIIIIWLVGYLLSWSYFSKKEQADNNLNGSTPIDIYDEDDDDSNEAIEREFWNYKEESKNNV